MGFLAAMRAEQFRKLPGPGKIIVETSNRSIEDPAVVAKILKHLGLDRSQEIHNRAPPVALFDSATTLL